MFLFCSIIHVYIMLNYIFTHCVDSSMALLVGRLGSGPPPFRARFNYAHASAENIRRTGIPGRPGRKHHVRVDVG